MIKLPSSNSGSNYMIYHQIDTKIRSRKIEDLIELPKIVLVNKFDEESANLFREQFTQAVNTGQPIIPIVIDSYGGQVYSLMSMIATIKNSPVPVATVGTGKMMSCGSILFSCGAEDQRYMDSMATLMIHDVSSHAWGKIEELKADVNEAERLNKIVYALMAKNCGKEPGYFIKLVNDNKNADLYLSAEDCKKHNLTNHIRIPSFKIKVNAELSFA